MCEDPAATDHVSLGTSAPYAGAIMHWPHVQSANLEEQEKERYEATENCLLVLPAIQKGPISVLKSTLEVWLETYFDRATARYLIEGFEFSHSCFGD